MKHSQKIIGIFFILLATRLTNLAVEETPVEEPIVDLPSYEFVEVISLPKPRRSPVPKANKELVGLTVNLRFTVNEKGDPENIRLEKPLSSYADNDKMTFASQTMEAIGKWRFHPALDSNDKPLAVKVKMPVRVVKYGMIYRAMATVVLDEIPPKK
jgi:hypothetical protein